MAKDVCTIDYPTRELRPKPYRARDRVECPISVEGLTALEGWCDIAVPIIMIFTELATTPAACLLGSCPDARSKSARQSLLSDFSSNIASIEVYAGSAT